ncbi:MAG: type II 3-dehydroquinate dehydratase [Leptospiraceae bacterium]|nr:type II 3-dehydroquinate dehydratase [Leptospiraceae bacterium]
MPRLQFFLSKYRCKKHEKDSKNLQKFFKKVQLKILIINGPNLNLLGVREPEIYGNLTLQSIEQSVRLEFEKQAEIIFFQSNSEGEIVDKIQDSLKMNVNAIVINAGAYTHTSIAIPDALSGVKIPFIEVHISNTFAREEFRHHSYLSSKATAVIAGLGAHGYSAAVQYFIQKLREKNV